MLETNDQKNGTEQSLLEQITAAYECYFRERTRFETNGSLRAGVRARKALMELKSLCSQERAEILNQSKKIQANRSSK